MLINDCEEYQGYKIYSRPQQNTDERWYPWIRILPPRGDAQKNLSGTASEIGTFSAEDEAKIKGFNLGKEFINEHYGLTEKEIGVVEGEK